MYLCVMESFFGATLQQCSYTAFEVLAIIMYIQISDIFVNVPAYFSFLMFWLFILRTSHEPVDRCLSFPSVIFAQG